VAATFLLLLTAHLIGDFLLQPGCMVRRKREWKILLLHGVLLTALPTLMLGAWHGPIILTTFVTHCLIDTTKTRFLPNRPSSFAADQVAHWAVVCSLSATWPNAAADGLWFGPAGVIPAEAQPLALHVLAAAAAFIVAVPCGGILIRLLTAPLVQELEREAGASDAASPASGLAQGGQCIGWLERALVLLLVGIGETGGIGFVLAAKTLLRFGEIREGKQRKLTEYVIIGTFSSFGWGLAVAAAMRAALDALG